MPITINGTGTIAGISVGGLENGCVNEADLATAAVTNTKLASTAVTIDKLGTSEQSQLCKAWVNFNGTGTVAIRASFNVSSITDNGVGNYQVNLTTAFVDAQYCTVSNTSNNPGVSDLAWGRSAPTSSSSVNVYCFYKTASTSDSAATYDPQTVHVAVFR